MSRLVISSTPARGWPFASLGSAIIACVNLQISCGFIGCEGFPGLDFCLEVVCGEVAWVLCSLKRRSY